MSAATTVRDQLLDQFNRSFQMLRTVFDYLPDGQWTVGFSETFTPAMIAYHTVESLDFYVSGKTGDQFPWGYRFRGHWWETSKENLPSKDEMTVYLQETEERVTRFLNDLDDNTLLETSPPYDWSGKTLLGHLVYALRHTMHHQGQLTALQLHLGQEGESWR